MKTFQLPALSSAGLIFLMLIMLAPVPVSAQGLSQAQLLDGLANRYRNLNSIQTTYSRVANTPASDQLFKSGSSQVATGILYWARPAKLFMDQQSPQPEAMITDGSTVWWHIPSEQLVYRYRNIDVAGQLKPLMSFLGGLDTLNSDYNVALAPFDSARPGQYGLTLSPKAGADGGVDRLTVWCDDAFTLTGFRLTSVTGETTDFYLTGFKENPKLENRLFSFRVPRGTEVIEE